MGHIRGGGIKDKVAIIGVGATKFGENWEWDQYKLLHMAAEEAFKDAGIKDPQEEIDAMWCGMQYYFTGLSGGTAADGIRIYGKPVTRVENYCASGMDSFRNACYGVASGVVDVAYACGVEKLLDEGSSGLPGFREMGHPILPLPSAPAMFCMAATRCFHEYGWTKEDLARVAVKNHKNGVAHPKAHFRKAITMEDAMNAPMIADPLGRFDCCAMSDGSAGVVITAPELAESFAHSDDYVLVKAAAISVHTNTPWYHPKFPFTGFPSTQEAAQAAYKEAGITDPRAKAGQIDVAEVHDCFTITELVNCEDMAWVGKGEAAQWYRDGGPEVDGDLAVNPSGGLKCFGHPIGATGCRMVQEVTRQIQGRAQGMQRKDAKVGVCHNLGGAFTVGAVTILGQRD